MKPPQDDKINAEIEKRAVAYIEPYKDKSCDSYMCKHDIFCSYKAGAQAMAELKDFEIERLKDLLEKEEEEFDYNPAPPTEVLSYVMTKSDNAAAFLEEWTRIKSENQALRAELAELRETPISLQVMALQNELKEKTEVFEHLQRKLNNGQTLEPEGPNHIFINKILAKYEGGNK